MDRAPPHLDLEEYPALEGANDVVRGRFGVEDHIAADLLEDAPLGEGGRAVLVSVLAVGEKDPGQLAGDIDSPVAQRLEGPQRRGERALHVRRAASPDFIAAKLAAEGRDLPGLHLLGVDGNGVHMAADDEVAARSPLPGLDDEVRHPAFEFVGLDPIHAERFEFGQNPAGDLRAIAGRVLRRDSDQLPGQIDDVVSVHRDGSDFLGHERFSL